MDCGDCFISIEGSHIEKIVCEFKVRDKFSIDYNDEHYVCHNCNEDYISLNKPVE